MMNMKRLLSLILAFALVLGMIPVPAFATEGEEVPSVDVVLSLSTDEHFMVGPESGAIMAMKDISVPYFDLALYGLEEYYFVSEIYGDDGDGMPGSDLEPGTPEYANGKVTLLHLYIYALELFYCGIDPEEAGKGYLYDEGLIGTEVFSISGGVGSSFLNQFWGGDCNLNYYVNYEYPLASEGWCATADQILLRDGDIVTLGHFTGWSFYADPYSIFNYITADKVNPVKGEEVTLTLYYAGANMGNTDGTAQNLNTNCLDVYYAPVNDIPSEYVTDWEYLGTADENGQLVVDTSVLEAGEYIFAVAGQYGESYTDEICSTPGGVRVSVEEAVEKPAVSLNDITIVVPDSLTPNETEDGIIYTGLKIFQQYTFSYVTDPEGLDVDVTWRFVDAGNNSTIDNADIFSASAYMNGMATLTLTATCGDVTIEKNIYITDKLPHEHSYEAVVAAPTCTEGGYTTYTCECGDSYIADETAALGHTEEIIPSVAPTCTETGLTEGKKCSVCGETLVAQEVVAALGHDYVSGECSRCDAVKEASFEDVPVGSFYFDPVEWAVENGITSGTTETTFNPAGDLLRAQVVTMLWRHAGSPVVDIANPFNDVKEGEWYYDAVLWACSEGITVGTSATTFDPAGKTNRAQVVTFLWRYLDEPEADTENPFTDVDTNEWYGKAVLWAVANGVTDGMSEEQFGVSINCNRAHMVTFLYRALA